MPEKKPQIRPFVIPDEPSALSALAKELDALHAAIAERIGPLTMETEPASFVRSLERRRP